MVQVTYTFTDSRLVNLDGADAGLLEVDDLVAKSKSKLLRLEFTGDISTGERPVEDGDRAGQHSLHGALGQALGVGTPLDGDGSRAADIRDDDRRTHVAVGKR